MLLLFKISSGLKQLRKNIGYPAKCVTEMLKQQGFSISEKTLYGYESGISMPNADVFMALCQIYECRNPMSFFIDGEEKAPLYSSEAEKLARDYDALDNYGKKAVQAVVDVEKARCVEQSIATTTKLYIAARDGSRMEVEADDDLTLPDEDSQLP